MNLNDAKTLLEKRRIPYHMARYESEAEYWQHLMPFPRTANARKCPVTALVIPAPNGVKHIELQFIRSRDDYIFEDLWFGGYSFEMFDYQPDMLEADLLDLIGRIADGKLAVIEANDPKRKRWIMDSCFDLKEDDNVFGAPGFREALSKIEAPKSFWQKLTGKAIQYDIYDWRTHRQIVK